MSNTQNIKNAVADIVLAVRELELQEEWLENADLSRAFTLACDNFDDDFAARDDASTRALLDALAAGLPEVYDDLTVEDFEGRQWGCPIRWLFFRVCDARREIEEASGEAWWQKAARGAQDARAERDAEPVRKAA